MRKGHKYISVFVDMDKGDVLHCTQGKGSSTIKTFKEELVKHGGIEEKVTELSMDMSPSFISGAAEHFPKAQVTFDKFHVVKLLNEALDAVRRSEKKENPLLTGSRYLWLKNPSNLTNKQQQSIETLSKENLVTAKVYRMKLTLQDIYSNVQNRKTAEQAMWKWYSWAIRSRIEPVKKFAGTLKAHMEGILRYFDSGLTAGRSEGVNSRIQQIKARARGFRNIDNFISVIYLEMSGLSVPDLYVAHSK